MIIPEESKVFKSFFETLELKNRYLATWSLQKKGAARLKSVCSKSELAEQSKCTGQRMKVSQNCNCSTIVSTIPLLLDDKEQLTSLISKGNGSNSKNSTWSFFNIKLVNIVHTNHILDKSNATLNIFHARFKDILDDEKIKEYIIS